MTIRENSIYQYQGGSLPPNSPSYVERKADKDLYEGLKAGNFCYVLNSRQMGKTSLALRTMQKLKEDQIAACAFVNLNEIGIQDVTPEQWYAGIIRSLVSSFHLSGKFNWRTWWRERDLISPLQRLGVFIEDVLLLEIKQNIVIFIDEIDSVLNLKFSTDDFFGILRACYDKRGDQPEYKRLTFTLLGVATPSSLIQNKNCTPFNIGRAITLNGFQLHEAQPLVKGLQGKAVNPQTVLEKVLVWTGGQPFLTQKLCQLVISSESSIPAGREANLVWNVVQSRVIKNWESQDEPEHLRTIRDRILRDEQRARCLLNLYQKLLDEKKIISDYSSEQVELRLSGLVVKEGDKLKVYNRIYGKIFSKDWVKSINKTLAISQPYREALTAWISSDLQKESVLLRGQALQEALVWAEDKNLSIQDYRFLIASQVLDKRVPQELVGRASNPLAIIREIHAWTNGQPVLTQILCQLILQSHEPISAGREAEWVETLVRSRLIENWPAQEAGEHLKTIIAHIFRDNQHAVHLLERYRIIVQQGEVVADDSPEELELQELGLVVKKQEIVRVHNRIYQLIFNLNLVNRALEILRQNLENQGESKVVLEEEMHLNDRLDFKFFSWISTKNLLKFLSKISNTLYNVFVTLVVGLLIFTLGIPLLILLPLLSSTRQKKI